MTHFCLAVFISLMCLPFCRPFVQYNKWLTPKSSSVAKSINLSKSNNVQSPFSEWYEEIMQLFTTKMNDSMVPISIQADYAYSLGKLGNNSIEFQCNAFKSSRHIDYLRHVSFQSVDTDKNSSKVATNKFNVFNFVVLPNLGSNIPILGIDIITLPGGSLAAIDFQPLIPGNDTSDYERYFNSSIYKPYKEMFEKHIKTFPSGGALPEKSRKYFSPYVLWTRLPNSEILTVQSALYEYVIAYIDIVNNAVAEDPKSIPSKMKFLQDYLTYR